MGDISHPSDNTQEYNEDGLPSTLPANSDPRSFGDQDANQVEPLTCSESYDLSERSTSNVNNSSDTIPLRLGKQVSGDGEYMIEWKLNKD
ncbi:14555_t:CDS:1, partial [Acaulospora colombiana]